MPTPAPTPKTCTTCSVQPLLEKAQGLATILKPPEKRKEGYSSGDDCNQTDNSALANATTKITNTLNGIEYKMRQTPLLKNSAYPWNNHDFDYAQVVKNQYTPKKMGISCEPCLNTTINDILNLPNYLKPIMEDPIPDSQAVAGKTDVDTSNSDSVALKAKYDKIQEPYPGFKKEYAGYMQQLNGEGASSYFLQTGFCKAAAYKDEKSCKDKGFTWVPNPIKLPAGATKFFPGLDTLSKFGGCYKPRYSFINNKPGGLFGVFKGIGPTLGKEFLEMNPVSFIDIFMTGKSPAGDFTQLPCNPEGFVGHRQVRAEHLETSKIQFIGYILAVILTICVIGFVVNKLTV